MATLLGLPRRDYAICSLHVVHETDRQTSYQWTSSLGGSNQSNYYYYYYYYCYCVCATTIECPILTPTHLYRACRVFRAGTCPETLVGPVQYLRAIARTFDSKVAYLSSSTISRMSQTAANIEALVR
jgi:hypothetical protein